jgi:hypothetical protein
MQALSLNEERKGKSEMQIIKIELSMPWVNPLMSTFLNLCTRGGYK